MSINMKHFSPTHNVLYYALSPSSFTEASVVIETPPTSPVPYVTHPSPVSRTTSNIEVSH